MGKNHRGTRRTHSKHNNPHRSHRRSNKTGKDTRPRQRKIASNTNTDSTGRTPYGALKPEGPKCKPKAETKSSSAWENIVLHYLSKLRNVWRPVTANTNDDDGKNEENEMTHPCTPASRENSATRFRRERHNEHIKQHLSRYRQSSPAISNVASVQRMRSRVKAHNIVSNALEYGLANGIVSKNGNFFWLKHKLKRCNDVRSGRKHRRHKSRDRIHLKDMSHLNMEEHIGHHGATNRNRPAVGKRGCVLPSTDPKIRKANSRKSRSIRTARSRLADKSGRSRSRSKRTMAKECVDVSNKPKMFVSKVPSSVRKQYMERAVKNMSKYESLSGNVEQKPIAVVPKAPSSVRDEYMARFERNKAKNKNECQCHNCVKKYHF